VSAASQGPTRPAQRYASAVATKKQRRRRDKSRRHEWEYVYVDDEGREVEVDEADLPPQATRDGKQDAKPKPKAARDGRGRTGRQVEPPSWNRVGRRALVFAPLMFLVVWFLRPDGAAPIGVVVQVLVLLGFFLPFSYVMDSLVYRMHLRRSGQVKKAQKSE
jgi:hypothetical protein